VLVEQRRDKTYSKQDSFGGLTIRRVWLVASCLRGREGGGGGGGGGGTGFVTDIELLEEGMGKFVGRKS